LKKHDKILIALGTFSLVFVLIFEVIARDCTEWFAGAGELVSVLVNIFLSCLAGCIIYFISCYLPLREIERKRHEEQVKVDEIVAVHLRNVLDSISRIFIVAYGDWAKFESIVLNPLDEVEFKSIAKNIKGKIEFIKPNIFILKKGSEYFNRQHKASSFGTFNVALREKIYENEWSKPYDDYSVLKVNVVFYSPSGINCFITGGNKQYQKSD
jgi:hypothetical protein